MIWELKQTLVNKFNNSELSKGFHLLTESAHDVKVNIPTVPDNLITFYPRLAGFNWTCYLNQPCVVLGRSTAALQQKTQKNVPHVDLGDSKAISRRHCEFRYSARRDRWELYVYGRNGVKLNQMIRKPKEKPIGLKTSDLIEIDNTRFIFVLPPQYIRPNKSQVEEESEANTPGREDEILDLDLEKAIVQLFKSQKSLCTKDLLDQLKNSMNKEFDKQTLIHFLVRSKDFQLAPNSIQSNDSDTVIWIYSPSQNKIETNENNPIPEAIAEVENNHTLIIEGQKPETVSPKPLGRLRSSFSKRFDSLPPISLSKLFINDGSWTGENHILNSVDFDGGEDINQDFELSIPGKPDEASQTDTAESTAPLPVPFNGLSIETMYCLWNFSQENSNEDRSSPVDTNTRPRKRLKFIEYKNKHTQDDTSNENSISKDELSNIKTNDIFKEIRTKIIESS